jgi:hypothetical protein
MLRFAHLPIDASFSVMPGLVPDINVSTVTHKT